MAMITSINPATEEVLAEFEPWSDDTVDHAVDQVVAAQRTWRKMSIEQRAVPMRRAAELLRQRSERYGALITSEMGKPIVEAEAEVEKCAWNCDYYAEHAAEYLADAPVADGVARELRRLRAARRGPGDHAVELPVLAGASAAAAPALMAGNGVVLKHASNVPQSRAGDRGGPARRRLARRAVPHGAGLRRRTTERLIDDPRIAAVTLTGSSEVGARVASAGRRRASRSRCWSSAGRTRSSSSPTPTSTPRRRTAARARNQNNGQSCIAAKRFIVEEPVADEFGARFADAVDALRVGDPVPRDTNVGPLARGDLRDTLERQVERIASSGRPAARRRRAHRPGAATSTRRPCWTASRTTCPPSARRRSARSRRVVRARDADDAVELANDTEYGLGAARLDARPRPPPRRSRGASRPGAVFVNGMVASDPRLPFGGVKRSGYGRELGAVRDPRVHQHPDRAHRSGGGSEAVAPTIGA